MPSPRPTPARKRPIPTALKVDPDGLSAFDCPHCMNPLDLQQPDPEGPELLLGICADCGRWCLIAVNEDRDEAFLLALPEVAALRTKIAEHAPMSRLDAVAKP